jgi:hypothetical protein
MKYRLTASGDRLLKKVEAEPKMLDRHESHSTGKGLESVTGTEMLTC